MNLQSKILNIFVKVFSLAFLSIFLFACNFPSKVPSSLPSSPPPAQAKMPPIESFSIQDANNIAPDDVLKEVSYSPTGGVSGGCSQKTYSNLTLEYNYFFQESDRVEWLDDFSMMVCGWQTGEVVSMTIKFPDGKITKETLIVESDYEQAISETVFYYFTPSIDEQVGVYSFIFEGNKSGTVSHDVTIYIPPEPKKYALNLNDTKVLYLYGYAPNERVRLFLYDTRSTEFGVYTYSLTAWKDYYVNDNGQLIIKTESLGGFSYAVGDISGVNVDNRRGVITKDILLANSSPSSTAASVTSCQSNLPSRLGVGKYAYLSTNPPLNVRVRSNAGLNGDSLGFIESGDIAEILEGPQCVDGMTWWKVKSTANPNLIGWSSEGDTKYLLFPCSSSSSCP